jgi:hypothetical protein
MLVGLEAVAQSPAPAPGSPSPEYTAPAAPSGPLPWYQSGYAHIGGNLGFHGWGSLRVAGSDLTITCKFLAGVNLSGYSVISPHVHLGGYFRYGRSKAEIGGLGTDADHYSAGLSLKAGHRVAERVWVGLVGDLGFYAISPQVYGNWYGVEISPRVHMDVRGIDVGGFKLGFFASFGPSIVPYAAGTIHACQPYYPYSCQSADGSLYLIYLQLHVGATFGR